MKGLWKLTFTSKGLHTITGQASMLDDIFWTLSLLMLVLELCIRVGGWGRMSYKNMLWLVGKTTDFFPLVFIALVFPLPICKYYPLFLDESHIHKIYIQETMDVILRFSLDEIIYFLRPLALASQSTWYPSINSIEYKTGRNKNNRWAFQ